MEIAVKRLNDNYNHVLHLKNLFINELTSDFDNYKIISTDQCSPYILSFAIPNVKAETTLHMAESEGVLISNGSACSSKKSGNRILEAMGVPSDIIKGSVRVSFGEFNTDEEVVQAAKVIKTTCTRYLKILK